MHHPCDERGQKNRRGGHHEDEMAGRDRSAWEFRLQKDGGRMGKSVRPSARHHLDVDHHFLVGGHIELGVDIAIMCADSVDGKIQLVGYLV